MKIVFDLDGTLCEDDSEVCYLARRPISSAIDMLVHYKTHYDAYIIISTARNMKTFAGSIGKINAFTLPDIVEWLKLHNIPYDEIYVGKPWCGEDGFYVDDRSIRPSEFCQLSLEEIHKLLQFERRYFQPKDTPE